MKRAWGVDRGALRGLLETMLAAERAPGGQLAIAFVGDGTMRRRTRDYRGQDQTTDVLSFSYVDEPHSGGILGEIYVSAAVVERQAGVAACPFAEELARVVLHGTLHVLGWTHDTAADRRRMFGRQERYLKAFTASAAPC